MPSSTLNTSVVTAQTNNAVASMALIAKSIAENVQRLQDLSLKVKNDKLDLANRDPTQDAVSGNISNEDAIALLAWADSLNEQLKEQIKDENGNTLMSPLELLRVIG